jgi:hypothetical protein
MACASQKTDLQKPIKIREKQWDNCGPNEACARAQSTRTTAHPRARAQAWWKTQIPIRTKSRKKSLNQKSFDCGKIHLILGSCILPLHGIVIFPLFCYNNKIKNTKK